MKENLKLCVYAICKNESKFVDRWVNAISEEADSIVVLDTGSTDDTVEKLRAHGVTVVVKEIKPWRFDVARNEAMKLVPNDCNILLSTDLDEVLEPGWGNILREKWIEGVHERAEYKYSWSHLEDGSDGRIFRYNKIHTRKWVWKAPVHELLWNVETKTNLYNYNESLDLFDQIHLHHYPDKTKSRASYLPLLELRAQEDPNDYYGLIYLAHEYYYRGKYKNSIDTFKNILEKFKGRYDSVELASCYLFMGDSYTEMKDFDHAIDSYKQAIITEPTYIEPYLDLAKVYIDKQQYKEAVDITKDGIAKSYRHYTWLERDTSWSYEPWDLLCIASYYAGSKKDSIAYAAKALSYEPNNKRLSDNLKACLNGTGNHEMIK